MGTLASSSRPAVIRCDSCDSSAAAAKPGQIPLNASVLMDVVRLGAALAVVADHASLPEFHLGWRDRQLWGHVAVPVFFVLSGFVIRSVTVRRSSMLRDYAIDRASRIYSVALPAMLLSLFAGAVCFLLNPAAFRSDWMGTFAQPVPRVLLGLAFLNQSWGLDATPFLNLPYWSLGYECLYYALFGCFFYLRGRARAASILLLALAAGPQVLFLLPTWALGCAVHDTYRRLRDSARARQISAGISSLLLAMFALALLGLPVPLHSLLFIVSKTAALPNPLGLAGLAERHATMFALAAGVFAAPVLLMLLLASELIPVRPGRATQCVRRLGDSTFALYLMHYPLLVLLLFMGLLRPDRSVVSAGVVAGLCLALIAISPVLDRLKLKMRSAMHNLFVYASGMG